METILHNPTLEQVNETLAAFATAANQGQRSRLATLIISEKTWELSEAVRSEGGEAVANSYRQTAYSTLISTAWITLPNGERIVRCYGDRIRSPKNSHGRTPRGAFNMTERQVEKANFVALVLPSLFAAVLNTAPQEWKKTLQAEEASPADFLVYADWLDENARGGEAELIRSQLNCQLATVNG